jgi:hypothetical protein
MKAKKDKKRPEPLKTEAEPVAMAPVEEKRSEEHPVEEKHSEDKHAEEQDAPEETEDNKLEPPEQRKSGLGSSSQGDATSTEGREEDKDEPMSEEEKPVLSAEDDAPMEDVQEEAREQPEPVTPKGLQSTGLLCGCI